jgi:hypothetical protein
MDREPEGPSVLLPAMMACTLHAPPPPYDTKFSARSYTEGAGYPPSIDAPDGARRGARRLLVDEYDGAIARSTSASGACSRRREIGELERTLVGSTRPRRGARERGPRARPRR